MQFHVLRLFLSQNDTPELWTRPEDRSRYLERVFTEEIPFLYRGTRLVYVFIQKVDGHIVGRIGRQVTIAVHEPPERGLEPTTVPHWEAAHFVLDTSHGPTGQIAFVEREPHIGTPLALTRALCNALNERLPAPPWILAVNPLADETGFWEAAAAHRGRITELAFTFLAPNVFGASDSFDDELRRLRDEEHIQEIEARLRNSNGNLNPETPRVRRAVHEVERGGARAAIKVQGKTVYDSDARGKKISVDKENSSTLHSLVRALLEKVIGS